MSFKVANIITAYNSKSGGPPRVVSLMAAAGAGHWHSELFTTDYRESALDNLLVADFPGSVNMLPQRCQTLLGGLSMLVGVRRGVRAEFAGSVRPDLVHIHGMWHPYLAAYAAAATRLSVPYIVAPHGMLEPWSLSVRSLRKTLAMRTYQGWVLERAAALHATGELEAESLRRLTRQRVPVFVVPNAVESPPVRAAPVGLNGGVDGKRVLLFLSRLHEKKGLDMLLKAWNQTRPDGWRLLIVGSGEARYAARLVDYCESNRVPHVEFRPHVEGDEREAVFASAALFVLPTYSENFGSVVAEALIRGVPVITTTGTPWAQIETHRCGWFIEPEVGALQRAIVTATATDGATLAEMGARGRDYAQTNFSVAAVRDALLRMYQSAMQTPRRGSIAS